MPSSPLADWVRREIRMQGLLTLLALLYWLPASLVLIFSTWCLVGIATLFLAPWVGLADYKLITTTVATLLLLVLLWWENHKYAPLGGPPIAALQDDFSEGDGELGPQVLNILLGIFAVLTATTVGRFIFAPGESVGEATLRVSDRQGVFTAPKLITACLFVVPRTLQSAWKAAGRLALLPRIDAEAVAVVLELLLAQDHKVSFGFLQKKLQGLANPVQAVADLVHFDGVLFLVSAPRGVFLSTDLRRELRAELRG